MPRPDPPKDPVAFPAEPMALADQQKLQEKEELEQEGIDTEDDEEMEEGDEAEDGRPPVVSSRAAKKPAGRVPRKK